MRGKLNITLTDWRVVRFAASLAHMAVAAFLPSIAQAQSVSLSDYLTSIDKAQVSIEGKIRFVSLDDEFVFVSDTGDHFKVSIDAGRDVREKIQRECDIPNFQLATVDLCSISGHGTVEIRGSRIQISLDELTDFSSSLASTNVQSDDSIIFQKFKPCWNVGTLSREAMSVKTTLSFRFSGSRIEVASIKPKTPIETQAERAAYEAARRAVVRCGSTGFSMPNGQNSGTADVTFKY